MQPCKERFVKCRLTGGMNCRNKSLGHCSKLRRNCRLTSNHSSLTRSNGNLSETSDDAGCAAFTMMEVVFAMAVVGFLFVALYAAIATSVGMVRTCQENERVTQILSEKLDTIRLYNWTQINSNGFIPTNFTVGIDPLYTNSTPYYTGRISIVKAPAPLTG